MSWIVCGVLFIGGFFVGVILMALLSAAREPETRPPLTDEAETGYLQRRLAPDAAGLRTWITAKRAVEQSEGPRQVEL